MNCRHCGNSLNIRVLDLGFAPPSNAYLTVADLSRYEKYYPLNLMLCNNCWLVQIQDFTVAEELFSVDYAYFSSASKSWLAHGAQYTEKVIELLKLDEDSLVVEIASNDGYLLKNFVEIGIPCFGIEPTASTADVAEQSGITVLREFFSEKIANELSRKNKKADLIVANNVYAHVPDINDFTSGLKALLKSDGTITLEFPHVAELINGAQFDTVYHEHFSYLSFTVVYNIFKSSGLRVWDVERLNTHGGSLRVYGCHDNSLRISTDRVMDLLEYEKLTGLQTSEYYSSLQTKVNKIKNDLLDFLIQSNRAKKKVVAYGAAAKGNTLLNYAGIKADLIPFVCDVSPFKQGKFMPGSHIPILSPSVISELRPDFILILPWNIAEEVMEQLNFINDWGGRFVTAVPELKII